jgi:hypothetical protein
VKSVWWLRPEKLEVTSFKLAYLSPQMIPAFNETLIMALVTESKRILIRILTY